MRNRLRAAAVLTACLFPTIAPAEFGGFVHEGCTKDNFMVREQILWDCQGACSETPLRASIMEEATRTMEIYPQVVASFTKSQVARRVHVSEVRERADLKSTGMRAHEPQFVGMCNPLESMLLRSMDSDS
ncbi:MAG: hypothetical protein JJ913_14610 [Rhizobiaceae bacterium]|nr:hypothetical protein [Rhizobiaceae bacterium]